MPDAGDLTGLVVKDLAANVIPNPDIPTGGLEPDGTGIGDLPPGDIREIVFVDSALYLTAGGKDAIERDLAYWPLQYDVDVFAVTDWENYEAVFGPDADEIPKRERAEKIANQEQGAGWLVGRKKE